MFKTCDCFNRPRYFRAKSDIGKKYGRLTIVGIDEQNTLSAFAKQSHREVYVKCRCDCGKEGIFNYSLIMSGKTTSCGCYKKERIIQTNKSRAKRNIVETCNDDGSLWLFDDKGNCCRIDQQDYDLIKDKYWTLKDHGNNKKYWISQTGCTEAKVNIFFLHQIIAEAKYGPYDHTALVPDHLSRDTSDNRRCNLVLKTNLENTHNHKLRSNNSSGKTGVWFNKFSGTYVSYITVNNRTIHLGHYLSFEDACAARINAESKYGFTCDDIVPEYDL